MRKDIQAEMMLRPDAPVVTADLMANVGRVSCIVTRNGEPRSFSHHVLMLDGCRGVLPPDSPIHLALANALAEGTELTSWELHIGERVLDSTTARSVLVPVALNSGDVYYRCEIHFSSTIPSIKKVSIANTYGVGSQWTPAMIVSFKGAQLSPTVRSGSIQKSGPITLSCELAKGGLIPLPGDLVYKHDVNTELGDCGSPIVHQTSKVGWYHVGGGKDGNYCLALSN
jgi:hypothetical protein